MLGSHHWNLRKYIFEIKHAFKNAIRPLLVHYMKEAVNSDRTTMYNVLRENGHAEVAELIRECDEYFTSDGYIVQTELLTGTHNFSASGGDTFVVPHTSSASLDKHAYASSGLNEVTGTGYTAGGGTLTNVAPTSSGTTAFTDFNDLTFASSTITARGALIYNSSDSNKAVAY